MFNSAFEYFITTNTTRLLWRVVLIAVCFIASCMYLIDQMERTL